MKRLAMVLAAFSLFLVEDAQAARYTIDTAHSSVTFKIRHLLSKTTGRFTKFSGVIDFDPSKPKQAKVTATIDVNSINTDNKKRDNHLRNKDFFEVKKYKTMTFKSTKVTKVVKKGKKIHLDIQGQLKIKKTTRTVTLKVVYLGAKNFGGYFGTRAGFSAKTSIDRHKFGVTTGKRMLRIAVGATVTIEINIEAVQKKKK